MLPASARLRRREDFDLVVRRGRRAGRGHVVVHLLSAGESLDAGDGEVARVGLIVGKNVGNAVRRNEVSRRLRHLMRDRLDQLSPTDRLVLRAMPSAAGRSAATLGADVDRALLRLRTDSPRTHVPA